MATGSPASTAHRRHGPAARLLLPLDGEHHVQGIFPGARRVVVLSEQEGQRYSVRLFLDVMEAAPMQECPSVERSFCGEP